MHLLCVLTREPGRVLSRGQLIEEIWQAEHVSDDAVSAAVYQLRRALGDRQRAPQYIETVPKRGYRWLAPVSETSAPAPDPAPDVAAATPVSQGPDKPSVPSLAPTPDPAPDIAAATPVSQGPDKPSVPSLAPTPDPAPDVAAATRVSQGPDKSDVPSSAPPAASAQLHPVLGSVRSPTAWVRVPTVVLIAAGLVAVSAAIAASTQRERTVSVDGDATSKAAASVAFRSAYLRGWYLLNQRDPGKLDTALSEFRRAIEIAPEHAGAHAGLAAGYCMYADLGVGDLETAHKNADRSLDRATRLDPEQADVLYARGLRDLVFALDLPAAESALAAAIRKDQTNPMFHGTLAWIHAARGRIDLAVSEAQRALELDPTSMISHFDLADLLAFARHFDKAADVVRQALALEPESTAAASSLAWVFAHMGRDRASYTQFRKVLTQAGAPASMVAAYEAAWRNAGLPGTLAWRAEQARRRALAGAGSWLASARLHARAGKTAVALDDLNRAQRAGSRSLVFVLDSPDFQSLRDNPAFTDLVRQVRHPN